jgi:hypothetical protein
MGLGALALQAGLAGGQYLLDQRAQRKAFEENKQFWHERFDKEAQYNSPVQQKARMQEAGLNPALMYKGGQTGGNVSGGGVSGKIAEKAQLIELAKMSAEVANIKEDAKKKESERLYIKSKTEGQGTLNKINVQNLGIKAIENANASSLMKLRLKKSLMDVLNSVEQWNTQVQKTGLTREQRETQKNINYKFQKLDQELIESGIDRESGWFQTLKAYWANNIKNNWSSMKDSFMQPQTETLMDRLLDPSKDIFGRDVLINK